MSSTSELKARTRHSFELALSLLLSPKYRAYHETEPPPSLQPKLVNLDTIKICLIKQFGKVTTSFDGLILSNILQYFGRTSSDGEVASIFDVDYRSLANLRNNKITSVQERLMLLLHASKCQAQHGQCRKGKLLWQHIRHCRKRPSNYHQCASSRKILSHYRRCVKKGKALNCDICGLVLLRTHKGNHR